MSEKSIVVQGASCKCQFGTAPDTLKVLSHKKEFANDKDGSKKLVATTKETGSATLEKNSFGSCKKMNNNPCKPSITEWKGFYEQVMLSNGGHMLLEDSKAICAVAGVQCIEITNHGQTTEASSQNFQNADKSVHAQLNPLVNIDELTQPQAQNKGVVDSFR